MALFGSRKFVTPRLSRNANRGGSWLEAERASHAKEPIMANTAFRRINRGVLGLANIAIALILARFLFLPQTPPMTQLQAAAEGQPSSSIRAPEFPAGFDWLNTDKPLTMRGLRGKIVLLDFWTYGCINCMHILPDLKKLERKYPNELVIISVHSAKFENEQETGNIRNALLRYNIEHPVLVDKGMRVWDEYAVRAWPTLVLIDHEGRVAGNVAGEGNYDILDKAIGKIAERARAAGKLDATPARFALEAAKAPATPLWYPGKVLADAASNHLFIADSNHNRIVIATLDGKVQAVAGSGEAGLKDGAFDEATFQNPQGLALRRNENGELTLFVADTNNHAIRALDLKRGVVTTVAGTGKQAAWRSSGGIGTKAAIASPWDLQLIGNDLYIAMAGPHQIWTMDLTTQEVLPYAGSGREARIDGNLQESAFAQPSGLATDGKRLFVADSEISAIRAVDLPGTGVRVTTLAGGDLFEFGDKDGTGNTVRLQHPLGLAYEGATLYLTDTYNSKIKTLDPANGAVTTYLRNAKGKHDQFYEPGGLSIANGKIYVADTNNHRIRVVDLVTKAANTLELSGLPVPMPAEPARTVRPKSANKDIITLPATTLSPNSKGELVLEVKLPPAHHLNADSPQRFEAAVEGTGVKLSMARLAGKQFVLPLRMEFTTGQAGGKGTVTATATVFYCTEGKGAVCKFKALKFRAPYEVKEGGGKVVGLSASLD